MAVDILGPANAANSVTTRPTDDRTFGVDNTWFKDCTSVTANDGTKVKSSWLNAVTGFARSLVRMNGNTLASVAIVTEDNADDMGARAVQHLVQRGQPNYARDTGTVNALVAALSPRPAEYIEGMTVILTIKTGNTGATVLNLNALGSKPVTHYDGSALVRGDLVAGAVAAFVYDGVNFQLAWAQHQPGSPTYLQAPATWYVNGATGSDTLYDGTSATVVAGTSRGPFATIQRGADQQAKFNMNGFNQTIYVADYSTGYAAAYLGPTNGTGQVSLIGNSTNPQNVPVSSTTGQALSVTGGNWVVDGFRLTTSGTGLDGITCGGGYLKLRNMRFGACVRANISANSCLAQVQLDTSIFTIEASANCGNHLLSQSGANINMVNVSAPPVLTILGPMTFFNGFAVATYAAVIQMVYSSVSGYANGNGTKYAVSQNGMISSFGNGVNYYPGTIAGTAASGGQYS